MKTLKTLAIVAITGLVGLSTVHASQTEGNTMHKGMKHQRGEMKKMFQSLDLSSEQKEQMKALRQEMKAQHKERKAAMLKGKGKMGSYVSANGFDKQGFVEMATKRSQMMIQRHADMFEKRMNILTPEQRTKFAQLLQEKQN